MFCSVSRPLLRRHDDFLLLQQIRSAVPGIPLSVDANMAQRLSGRNQLAKGLILPV